MREYNFYIYSNDFLFNDLSLKEAIKDFKKFLSMGYNKKYLTIGVNKGVYSTDLLVSIEGTIKLSMDYKKTIFNNNQLIKLNTMEILKREFNI